MSALERLFAEWQPQRLAQPPGDFSGLRTGAHEALQVEPRSTEALCRIVRTAHERGVPLRVRAQGHSLNGSSLPKSGELLLSTANLRSVRFSSPDSVTAGGGVVLWVLQHILRSFGFDLPVLNDGYPGPSVGGYLAAGGFGPSSHEHGGFWDNVVSVTLVEGTGELRRVACDDPLFPWLFGAMGQLGIVADATLRIIPAAATASYPAGQMLRAPRLVRPPIPAQFATSENERLFWFTLFVPEGELDEALDALSALERRHGKALRYAERYRYAIAQRRTAPLVYPEARPITATGAWGWLSDPSREGVARLLDFDADFMALAGAHASWRRYVQSELAGGPAIYERCFGAERYAELGRLKARLDPAQLLNRGSVFAPQR